MATSKAERITKRTVDAAKPKGRLYRIWDSDVKGFGLRVTPAGVKSYILAYRPGDGGRAAPKQEFTIARHGVLTPDEARDKAAQLLASVKDGKNPQASRDAARGELTIAALCDLYLAEGTATKKASTLATDRLRIERHIKPLLGKKRISAVTDADVQRFVRDVAQGKTAVERKPTRAQVKSKTAGDRNSKRGESKAPTVETRKRKDAAAQGGQGTATRTTGLLGAIFTFAVRRKMRPDNPVHGVERFKDGKSQRFLSPAELGRVGRALADLGEGNAGATVLRLLILTGARKSEIEGLRWDAVDIEGRCLRLADSKTGAKIVPLGAPALVVLAAIERRKGSPFVFASDRAEGAHFVGTPKVWEKIRAAAALDGVRIHDLRHTYASLAASGGQSLPLIGKLLGHRDVKTTAQYAHLADDPVRAAADRTAEAAAAAMLGTSAEVTRLKVRR
ncbi:tyrosine-type recombinase/integrase [Brevundimonas subvibrioides]|uniref:tyrosine-type recombinase/integrase n=1 Tax=Brevundimonas subvibrioides TaxID=74313 RepID=UPI0022B57A2C|nr:site-specific integrase [Brevundimonas subvibrioides]